MVEVNKNEKKKKRWNSFDLGMMKMLENWEVKRERRRKLILRKSKIKERERECMV